MTLPHVSRLHARVGWAGGRIGRGPDRFRPTPVTRRITAGGGRAVPLMHNATGQGHTAFLASFCARPRTSGGRPGCGLEILVFPHPSRRAADQESRHRIVTPVTIAILNAVRDSRRHGRSVNETVRGHFSCLPTAPASAYVGSRLVGRHFSRSGTNTGPTPRLPTVPVHVVSCIAGQKRRSPENPGPRRSIAGAVASALRAPPALQRSGCRHPPVQHCSHRWSACSVGVAGKPFLVDPTQPYE